MRKIQVELIWFIYVFQTEYSESHLIQLSLYLLSLHIHLLYPQLTL